MDRARPVPRRQVVGVSATKSYKTARANERDLLDISCEFSKGSDFIITSKCDGMVPVPLCGA